MLEETRYQRLGIHDDYDTENTLGTRTPRPASFYAETTAETLRPRSWNNQEDLNELKKPHDPDSAQPSPIYTESKRFLEGSSDDGHDLEIPKASPRSSRRFEPPDYLHVALHVLCCALIYPFFYVITYFAQNMSIFFVRLYVGIGCSTVAVAVGYLLMEFAKKHMQAATWATVIHQSNAATKDRMTLHELAALSEDAGSLFSALKLLYFRRRATTLKRNRLWSIYILLFIVLMATAAALSFAFGRIVNIVAQPSFDYSSFDEVWVAGALSEEDMTQFPPLQSWIILPNTTREPLSTQYRWYDRNWSPYPIAWNSSTPSYTSSVFDGNIVYIPEAYPAQLHPQGIGAGAAPSSRKIQLLSQRRTMPASNSSVVGLVDMHDTALVQYPKWGVRNACARLPNMQENLNLSAEIIHIPRDTVNSLASQLSLNTIEPDPDAPYFYRPEIVRAERFSPQLKDKVMAWGDQLKSGSIFSLVIPVRNISRSIDSILLDNGTTGAGWTFMDIFTFRYEYTSGWRHQENATFPYSYTDEETSDGFGVDCIICIERIEPWLVEVFNSTRSTVVGRILQRGDSVDMLPPRPQGNNPVTGDGLSSVGMLSALFSTYIPTLNDWILRSGNDIRVTPLDTSLTDGHGWLGFTELSVELYQNFRAISCATSVLPAFDGSKKVKARRYEGVILASAYIEKVPMIIAIALIFFAGLIAAFCVPTLPDALPRREFNTYSWMAMLNQSGDGPSRLSIEFADGRVVSLNPSMTLEEMDDAFGDGKIRYVQ